MARSIVLIDGDVRLAMACVDLIGLQYPAVLEIRRGLPKFAHVMVSSSHNHHAPDTIGLWGPNPLVSGVNQKYIERVIRDVIDCIGRAEARAVPVTAKFGTVAAADLLHDSRLPKVFDGVLRVLSFDRTSDGGRAGLLVQWNCHPEVMGRHNHSVTADFPAVTVARLKQHYQCPIAYFSGAVGGLMTPPGDKFKDATGQSVADETFPYVELYGNAVAERAQNAIDAAQPIELVPIAIATRPVLVPLENPIYQMARVAGLIEREAFVWTGDAEAIGEPLAATASSQGKRLAVKSEVGCLRLGELHVACIPGELYPELVYGEFPAMAEAGVDFPEATLETPVAKILPGKRWLLFGLANDEIGYIIPKRQWDQRPPFAYGRKTSQYGEINSCGPDVADLLMRALERRYNELQRPARN